MRFAHSAPFTLGAEEELFLVDALTFDVAPVFSEVVPKPDERVKPELLACVVETTTPICTSAEEVLSELAQLRRRVAEQAEPVGVRIYAAGTHPLAQPPQPIVHKPRYERMAAKLGKTAQAQVVCGLHVHVGMPSAKDCLRALEGILRRVPLLLSVSANSPFLEGEDSGVRSARIGRLSELESVGPPPVLRTWDDWERETAGKDYTRLWWDVRPHPRHGTLEVRIADQQTDVRRSAGLAALVHGLAAVATASGGKPYDRALYERRREEAARTPPDPAEVEALAAVVEPALRRLGGWQLVEDLLAARPEAEGQLEVATNGGGLQAVVRDVAERSIR